MELEEATDWEVDARDSPLGDTPADPRSALGPSLISPPAAPLAISFGELSGQSRLDLPGDFEKPLLEEDG